jgi:hypothetical protein
VRAGQSRYFSADVKRQALERCGHRCEGHDCGFSIRFRRFEFDHAIMWDISRSSALDNCQVLCIDCHLKKTAEDAALLARVRAISDKHDGIKGPGRGRYPMRAGKRSKERKTFSRGVVARVSQAEAYRRLMAERYPEGLR